MRNSNGAIVRKLTMRSFKSNKSRNIFVIFAIILTTILITSVFSIGMSFIETSELQQIRFVGTTASAYANNLTQAQVDELKILDYVNEVGQELTVANIKNTPDMSKKVSLVLHWFDKTQWEKFREPAISNFIGTYPANYNEVMMPVWTLEQMGIVNPKIGMEISVDYYLDKNNGSPLTHETFVLSGYYVDYMSARAGGNGYIAVSEDFVIKSGKTVERDGSVSFRYNDNKKIDEYNQKMTEDLSLTDYQEVRPWRHLSNGGSPNFSLAIFIAFIMLIGYLLIYNVLYISVSNDIRFYGLLKTIGTTPAQIKKIVIGQAVILSGMGIPIGLVIGALISFVLVPFVLNATVLEISGSASLNPFIFIGAAFFALVTTLISAVKPSAKASKISPVEAVRYTEAAVKNKKAKKTSRGKVYVMAWRNVFRDKKRAFVVLLSLFLGITVFMVTSSTVESLNFDNFVNSYMQDDFVLDNRTIWDISQYTEKFDKDFMFEINNLEGISNITVITAERANVKYDDMLSKHIDDFLLRFGRYAKKTKESILSDFTGYVIGIDTSVVKKINQETANYVDILAFERGDIALVETNNPEHFEGIEFLDITLKLSDVNMQIPIGGFISWDYLGMPGGGAPNIYVSKETLREMSPNAPIFRLTFDVDKQYEMESAENIKRLVGDDPEIMVVSKLEMQNQMANERLMLSVLGGGLSAILGLIGILNFVNIMSTSVMARKRELAILESIGMTKKQIEQMLSFEGISYAAISAVLIAIFGSAVTYGAFVMFKNTANFAVFSFPLLQLAGAIIMITIVCIITPKVAFRATNRISVVERLKESE